MNHIIKAILPPKRQGMRAVVVFENGSTKKYLPQTVAEQGLFAGMELTEAELAALEKANAAASAKQRAVRIISAAAVSKGDLQRRLTQKGESPEDAKKAVEWLSELKLLDDAETARQIVARGAARGYGAERVKQMLYEKRVPRQYWEEALAAMPDMSEALTDFLRKRLGEEPDEKTLRSASAAALRRGYTWSQVREALERLRNSEL
ncbi:MAG: regulatory protein RecX [Oscillospiraceae bacterium]|nr:regulatory protein RecX [Oscillospiraceae bacterium]